MPFTYKWSDAITLINKLIKGTPTSSIDAAVCDRISGKMYAYWPWSWTLTTGTVCTPTDGNQDFSPAAGIYRLIRARMVRTDTTPDQYSELDVRKTLAPDLVPRSYTSINAVSYEEAVGLVRLSSAVQIPSGTTLQIQGEWQVNPVKISATSALMWFPDHYVHVAEAGLLAWYYQLNDDPRAGQEIILPTGEPSGTGQWGTFYSALKGMARAEDYPATDMVFPDDGLGIGRSYMGTLNIFGNN